MATLTREQIRGIFAQEAAGRLTSLDQLLLRLETSGGDPELIQSLFREVHTLKGSAAVASLDDVSAMAHELEDLMGRVRSGDTAVTPEVIDVLFAGADRLRAAISGEAAPPPPTPAPAPPPAVARPATSQPAVARPTPVAPPSASPDPAPRRPSGPDNGVVMVQTERLDELVRLLGESAAAHLRVGRMLQDRYGIDPADSSEYNELSRFLNVLQDRVMRTRMVPVSTITDQLQRAVRDIARAQGKDVHWEVEGGATELDRGVLTQLSDSLLHLVRNAVDHGIEAPAARGDGKPAQATLRLHAWQLGSDVIIAVTDDGRGIDTARVAEKAARLGIDTSLMSDDAILQLIFLSGLSTTDFVTDISGRGVGLDVVKTRVEAARGRIEVRSEPGVGTEFRIVVPITLAVLRCLVVEAGGRRFALPLHRVVLSQAHDAAREIQAEGRRVVWVGNEPVTVSALADTLALGPGKPPTGPIVVLTDSDRTHAFQVDRLVNQADVVLKGLSSLLPPLPAVAGAGIEPNGSIFVVLDPPGLIQRARQAGRTVVPPPAAPRSSPNTRHVLVVDDALTVRELQRSILQRAGFDVRTANDGRQALAMLREAPADLVLTDVEMPHLDGFGLTEAIRAQPALANMPVLILSSLARDEDRQRGMDVGADGYIVKSSFDETALLTAVQRLLGGVG